MNLLENTGEFDDIFGFPLRRTYFVNEMWFVLGTFAKPITIILECCMLWSYLKDLSMIQEDYSKSNQKWSCADKSACKKAEMVATMEQYDYIHLLILKWYNWGIKSKNSFNYKILDGRFQQELATVCRWFVVQKKYAGCILQ